MLFMFRQPFHVSQLGQSMFSEKIYLSVKVCLPQEVVCKLLLCQFFYVKLRKSHSFRTASGLSQACPLINTLDRRLASNASIMSRLTTTIIVNIASWTRCLACLGAYQQQVVSSTILSGPKRPKQVPMLFFFFWGGGPYSPML